HLSRGVLRPDAPVAERCAVIEAEKANYPIAWMCRLLRVPRSSFYAWRAQVATETATAARRRQLAERVTRVFAAGRRAYGCRRVAALPALDRCHETPTRTTSGTNRRNGEAARNRDQATPVPADGGPRHLPNSNLADRVGSYRTV